MDDERCTRSCPSSSTRTCAHSFARGLPTFRLDDGVHACATFVIHGSHFSTAAGVDAARRHAECCTLCAIPHAAAATVHANYKRPLVDTSNNATSCDPYYICPFV